MKEIIQRVGIVYIIIILLSLIVIGSIINLQYFTKLDVISDEISFRIEETEATRGSILAHDGRSLSASVPYYQVRMDCIVPSDSAFNNNIYALSKALSGFFSDKSAAAYMADLVVARKEGKRYKSIGNRQIDYTELMKVRTFPLFNLGANRGGIIIEQKSKRTNPYGRLASRTVGFINTLGVGVGIEGSYDFYLKGIPGKQTVQRMLGGEWKPIDDENLVLPKDGYDVQTTLDIDIQEATEIALKEQLALSDVFEGGTAIVMEVKTGAIRAIANMKKNTLGEFEESFNYGIGQATEPGSTFKLATLVALIEDGYVTLDTPVDAGDGKWKYSTKTFSDVTQGGYGLINVLKAFEKSSNVSFAKLAVEYYSNNEKKYVDRLNNMKLNEKFNLDIMGEGRAVIYAPGDAIWSKLTLPMMAMGYASLLTPLHTLTFYNAIANGGKMMKPYFVENLQRSGVAEKSFPPQELSGSICSKSTIEAVHKALRGVVTEGTAKAFNDPRYEISGKTGTAQVAFDGRYIDFQGYRKHQASFAGFFPSGDPKYSAIVVLYTNKTRANFYGGAWAAPVFKKIADKIYVSSPEWKEPVSGIGNEIKNKPAILSGKGEATNKLLATLPLGEKVNYPNAEWLQFTTDSTGAFLQEYTIVKDSVPSVLNMGIKDAVYLLENQGYKVMFSGRGRVVSQTFAPDSIEYKKGIIQIQLSEEYAIKQAVK